MAEFMGSGDSMTKVNETKVEREEGLAKRLHRRSLLKAGAVVAPIALTLHGGVPLAHADSAGLCVIQLMEIANDQSDGRHTMLQVPIHGGQVAQPLVGNSHATDILPEDYPNGTKIEPFDASNIEHWNFIKDPINGRFGFSCVNSIDFNGRIRRDNGWGNGDDPAPGGSLPHNNAENGPGGNPQ